MIDYDKLKKLINTISGMTPDNGSEYSMGYHTSLMYIRRFVDGKEPFQLKINKLVFAIEEHKE